MPVYYIWGPHGKEAFNVDCRLEEILNYQNAHPHYNNYSPHGGNGGPNNEGTFAAPHLLGTYAFYQLPANGPNYYTEAVWNRPGQPPGSTRIIGGNGGELYLTTDHYHVYYKIFSAPGPVRTVFP